MAIASCANPKCTFGAEVLVSSLRLDLTTVHNDLVGPKVHGSIHLSLEMDCRRISCPLNKHQFWTDVKQSVMAVWLTLSKILGDIHFSGSRLLEWCTPREFQSWSDLGLITPKRFELTWDDIDNVNWFERTDYCSQDGQTSFDRSEAGMRIRQFWGNGQSMLFDASAPCSDSRMFWNVALLLGYSVGWLFLDKLLWTGWWMTREGSGDTMWLQSAGWIWAGRNLSGF